MSIRFECGKCGNAYTVDDQFAGKTAKCKGCGEILAIPEKSVAPPPPPAPIKPVEHEEILDISRFEVKNPQPAHYDSAPMPQGRFSEERGFFDKYKGQFIVGACITVIGGVVVALVLMFNKPGNSSNGNPAPGANPNPNPDPNSTPTFNYPGGLAGRSNPLPRAQQFTPETALTLPYIVPELPRDNGAVVSMTDPGSQQPFNARLLWPDKTGKVPLLLMPVSGTDGFAGADLTIADMQEPQPFVNAGYAVMQFSMPGVPSRDGNSEAFRFFQLSRGGLVPARMAIDLAIKSEHVDRDRIYVAARDSAGSVGLLLTGIDSRVKGGVFFSPLIDLPVKTPGAEVTQFASEYRPQNYVQRNPIGYGAKSIFVFHTATDRTVSQGQITSFVNTFPGKKNYVLLNQGDHDQEYKTNGIPAALYWLKKQLNPSMPDNPVILVNGSRATGRNFSLNGVQYIVDGIPVNGAQVVETGSAIAQVPQADPTVKLPGAAVQPGKNPPAGAVTPDPGIIIPTPDETVVPPTEAIEPVPELPKIILTDKDYRLRLQKAGALLKLVGETQDIEGVDLRTVRDFNLAMEVLGEMTFVPLLQITPDQISNANLDKFKSIKRIEKLDLTNAKINDDKIDLLTKFPQIEELNLTGNPLTRACAKSIASLTNVKKLVLAQTKIDNSVCPSLAKLLNLKSLDISKTSIDSAGIRQLKPLKDLAGLKINGLDVSPAAVKELQGALTKCNIIQ